MKANNILRTLTAAIALTAAAPSCAHTQADSVTDAQRACVQRVLGNPAADTDAIRKCLNATDTDDNSAKRPELAPDSPEAKAKIPAPGSPEAKALFSTLEVRFSKEAPYRPDVVKFADVKKALEARPDLLWSLNQMEKTGGQPDVIAVEGNTFVFADVSAESPEGRRNLDYDEAKAMCDKMGLVMMDKDTYRKLQGQIPLDTETWTWLLTDAQTRASGFTLGGYRFGGYVYVDPSWADYRDFNGGFRGLLRVPKL